MFVCFAGIITSADKKQLNIEVFVSKLSEKAQHIVGLAIDGLIITVLVSVFFAAWPNVFAVFDPADNLWGIPIRFIFITLPIMYIGILGIQIARTQKIIPIILGIAIGLFISTGSLASIIYNLFEADIGFLDSVFNYWKSFGSLLFWPLILILIASAFFGTPLYIVLLAIAYLATSVDGGYVDVVPLEGYKILTDTGGIAAIPLFTIAGFILAQGSAGKRLLELVKSSVGWLRGGVVIAAVVVAAFFTTFTGASGVTILALGSILSLILTGSGYDEENAEALITSSGAIGLLFPPSMAIIIFGATNIMKVNIFDLFKGALIPGILLSLSMIVLGIIKDKNKHRVPFSFQALLIAFKESIIELLLPILIIVGYFSGAFNLLQVAAFTVLFSFVMEVWIRKDFDVKKAASIILESVPIAGGVLVIVAAAKGLSFYLIDANVPDMLTGLVQTFVTSKYVFLLLLNILLLIVGCIMDLYSAIMVVSPLIMPIALNFDIHPVHTGVIFLMNLELGFLTPPVGMNLFISSYTFNKPVLQIAKKVLPFLGVQLIILLIVTYIPWFSTVLLQ
ncbi:TRAP transporter permease DctM/Q [Treponema phagedenis]|uniref:TRAP transporter large permease subunit n=1 Tax=Treponema phagedenis TaxID=162 RepID=A0AAE6IWP9_TREPH|nr:TRAP transporter large permease subunit [Treponema phagedenis]QEJ99606.1 TRAP transporter large permease subunit [Treponema phagedenis]QEK02271.1 TRAP transporter large permease subunit [Treponema phagedenis]QEK05160.1 TRAP transporter large permease subunit [Treponema phagedenis]QEK07858.1 TRAP transporter large permease subunit [Treponema phagedenis]